LNAVDINIDRTQKIQHKLLAYLIHIQKNV